jgi:histone demethylase JARID1
VRITDQEITDLLTKVKKDVRMNFESWVDKLNQIMSEPHVSPDMETLHNLLEMGQDTNLSQEALHRLHDYIHSITAWDQQVNAALGQKDDESRQKLALDLLQKAYSVGFDEREPKVAGLEQYLAGIDELNSKKMVPATYHQSSRHLRTNADKYKQLAQLTESRNWDDHVQKVLSKPFNQKNIKKLLREAKEHGVKGPWLDNLAQIELVGKNWLYRIDQILKFKEKINFGEEHELLQAGLNEENPQFSIVFEPQLMSKLRDVIESSRKTYHELEHILQVECKEPLLFDRPTVADAQRLVAASKEMIFHSDKLKIVSHELGRISLWNVKARATFMQGRQITKSLDTIIKETFSNVQSIVTGQDRADLYCVCRKQEAGLMVECDHCHDWYHNSCVKVPRSVVKSSMVYFCPICTGVSDSVHHLTKKPKFDAICNLITTANALMFCPKEYQMLNASYQLMSEFKDRVQTFCRSRIQLTMSDVPHIRKYLQSLEGLEIDLMDETEFLKSKLQYLASIHVNSESRELGMHEQDRKDNSINEPVIYHSGPTAIHESSYYSSGMYIYNNKL